MGTGKSDFFNQMTILYFIIALGVLVVVHEWGHFIVARLSGIRVLKFSIGFGPKLFGCKWGDTEYRVALIPLGGYVQLHGLDEAPLPKEQIEAGHSPATDPDSFLNKPLKNRLATVFAGPFMNMVLAALLMPVVFMVGRSVPAILEKAPVVIGVKANSPAMQAGVQAGDRLLKIEGEKIHTWGDYLNWVLIHPNHQTTLSLERNGQVLDLPLKIIISQMGTHESSYTGIEPFYFIGDDPIVGELSANGAAAKAGLQMKDRVQAIDGNPVTSWTELTEKIRGSEGRILNLSILRGTETKIVPLQAEYSVESKSWMIGIAKYDDPSLLIKKQYPFFQAIKEGTKQNIKLVGLTGQVVKRLLSFKLSYKALGGPVQIAQAAGSAARSGLGDFLFLMCFLSIQLGMLNLLPIPVLDGGHAFFMLFEAAIRRPLSIKVKTMAQQVGMALLLGLMVLVTFHDVDTTWGFANMWAKIKGIF